MDLCVWFVVRCCVLVSFSLWWWVAGIWWMVVAVLYLRRLVDKLRSWANCERWLLVSFLHFYVCFVLALFVASLYGGICV